MTRMALVSPLPSGRGAGVRECHTLRGHALTRRADARRPLPPGTGIPAPYPAHDPDTAAPSGMTPDEACSTFVLDFGPNLGYMCWCPGSMRGALARRRMCRSRERSRFGLASRAGRPIVARHDERLKEPCARGRQVLLPLTSEPDDLSRLPHPTPSEPHAREVIPPCLCPLAL